MFKFIICSIILCNVFFVGSAEAQRKPKERDITLTIIGYNMDNATFIDINNNPRMMVACAIIGGCEWIEYIFSSGQLIGTIQGLSSKSSSAETDPHSDENKARIWRLVRIAKSSSIQCPLKVVLSITEDGSVIRHKKTIPSKCALD